MIQLRMNTYPIKLSFDINNAQLKRQTVPPSMQIETTKPVIDIHQPSGQLTIDNAPLRESIGIKSFDTFARDQAELGRQAALEYIGKTAQKGNELARIHDTSVTIPGVVTRFHQKDPLELTWAPLAAPIISYQANTPEINVTLGEVSLTPQLGQVKGEYYPGSIDIKVTQYPKVEITTVDIKV